MFDDHDKKNCAGCGAPLAGLIYFCRPCFMLLPPKERVSLYSMRKRRQNTDSKVAKCVRIIHEKNNRDVGREENAATKQSNP